MAKELLSIESMFQKALLSSPESFSCYRIIRDEAGDFWDLELLYHNALAVRYSGVDSANLIGKRLGVLFPSHRDSLVWEDFRRVITTGEPIRSEVTHEVAGVSSWIETTTIRLSEEYLAIFGRDITERRRTEDQLRRSEEALQRAQQVAHLGSWDWRPTRNELVCSPELLAIFGAKPGSEFVAPSSLFEPVHAEERARVQSAWDDALREGGSFSLEYRIVRPEGTERSVLSQGEVLHEDGRPVRLVGTVLDITERKQAERERDESLQWLQAVLAQSPVGLILVHGAHGERYEANEYLQLLLGRRLELRGPYPGVVHDPEGKPIAGPDLPSSRALRGEQLRWAEYLLRHDKGHLIPVLASATPIRDRSGKVQGAVAAVQDITAVKELERLRAEWNSIIAHDLRQPLNTISLSSQILARETSANPRLRRPVEWIVRCTGRLTCMIEDLLDLSRLEAGQLTLSLKPLDLLALLQLSVEAMALEAPGRRFEVRAQGPIPLVEADHNRLAQVLDNLLNNAVKYSFADTTILIAVHTAAGHVIVEVTNSGPGIASDDLPFLFQRFRRTEAARHSDVQGIGLGLYITRRLIETHGGRITVESTPLATTTFRFQLPITQAP